jgi:hypothetical protein
LFKKVKKADRLNQECRTNGTLTTKSDSNDDNLYSATETIKSTPQTPRTPNRYRQISNRLYMTNQKFESFQPFQKNTTSEQAADSGPKDSFTLDSSNLISKPTNSTDETFKKRMGFTNPNQRLEQIETKIFYETTHESTKLNQFNSQMTSSSSILENYSL